MDGKEEKREGNERKLMRRDEETGRREGRENEKENRA